jgi:hypothetical protein
MDMESPSSSPSSHHHHHHHRHHRSSNIHALDKEGGSFLNVSILLVSRQMLSFDRKLIPPSDMEVHEQQSVPTSGT